MTYGDLIGFFQIVGALATAGAFWVTYLTLKELQKQTNLANDPLLKIRFRSYIPKLSNTIDFPILPRTLEDSPNDIWLNIINNNLRQDLSGLKDQILFIEFTNSGKSEITSIQFELTLNISMFDNDVLGFEIIPTKYSWHENLTVELSENNKILLSIGNTRYFPIHNLIINNLKFYDIRGKHFTSFDGPSETGIIENEILRPLPKEDQSLDMNFDDDDDIDDIPF